MGKEKGGLPSGSLAASALLDHAPRSDDGPLNAVVWFWRDGEGRQPPEPAIVVRRYEDGLVDLWVFCHHGAQRTEEKVPLAVDDSKKALVRYATVRMER